MKCKRMPKKIENFPIFQISTKHHDEKFQLEKYVLLMLRDLKNK